MHVYVILWGLLFLDWAYWRSEAPWAVNHLEYAHLVIKISDNNLRLIIFPVTRIIFPSHCLQYGIAVRMTFFATLVDQDLKHLPSIPTVALYQAKGLRPKDRSIRLVDPDCGQNWRSAVRRRTRFVNGHPN